MKLNAKQLAIINAHTLKEYPREAVFAITPRTAYPLENLHPEPESQFKVDARQFYKLKGIALVHSHPVDVDHPNPIMNGNYSDARTPSIPDMTAQMNMGIPFGILSCDGVEVTPILWFPDLDSPIEGQSYIHGIYDCYRLIRAYYKQNYNITLMDMPRDAEWYEQHPELYVNNFGKAGFYEITEEELKTGDVILLRIVGVHETHTAIYIDPDTILHHINNRLSGSDSYLRWRKKFTRFLRYDPSKATP